MGAPFDNNPSDIVPEGVDPLMGSLIDSVNGFAGKIGEMGKAAGGMCGSLLPQAVLVGVGALMGTMSWGAGNTSEAGKDRGHDAPAVTPPAQAPSMQEILAGLKDDVGMAVDAMRTYRDEAGRMESASVSEAAVLGDLASPLTQGRSAPAQAVTRNAGPALPHLPN